MKKPKLKNYTTLIGIDTMEGETIEEKVRRIETNKEPITDGAPIIYTEKKDGVTPAYNVRTDRWDVALMAMDAVNRAKTAKSENKAGTETKGTETKGNEAKGTEAKGTEA